MILERETDGGQLGDARWTVEVEALRVDYDPNRNQLCIELSRFVIGITLRIDT